MIVAVGSDLVEIERIAALWQRAGQRFLDRVYTAGEQAYCLRAGRPAASLAARFCAKEAVMKCLGTGSRVGWRSIEVVRAASGAVQVALHGDARAAAWQRGIQRVHLSLAHDDGRALAFAVAEG